jgi:hypothetical protein
MIPRPDLLDSRSPKDLGVFQLTTENGVPSCHIYMEAQIFTPDSKRFLLHRSAHAHGSDKKDLQHCYLLCDLEDGGTLSKVTDEVGAVAPSVSPDGQSFYYFVNETEVNSGRLTLKRRRIDGTDPEIITVVDKPICGTQFRPSQIYPISTIRSDGRKIAISAFLGDGKVTGNYGLLIFDLQTADVELILCGPSWCNIHPQYSRSHDPEHMRDILIQENHGCIADLEGRVTTLTGGLGADIHVIRDDGQNFRDMPWGRDGKEKCQGHQCWRGRSNWAITGTTLAEAGERQLIESPAVGHLDHNGLLTPDCKRNNLSRNFSHPNFVHFATNIEGRLLITDYINPENSEHSSLPVSLFLADLGEAGADAVDFTYLLSIASPWKKDAHPHPFLSPDGKTAFFNSEESGVLQAYMMRGFV